MSGLDSILQDLASEQFGPDANLRFQFQPGRVLAWLTRNAEGGEDVIAIAGGEDRPAAMRTLLQMLARDDLTLSTAEAAVVLGLGESRIRRMITDGSLVPVQAGKDGPGGSSRFSPSDVHRLAQLPRRRGAREVLAEQPEAHGFRPMAADVLRVMHDEGVDQDEAVRRLGGTP